MVPSLEGSRHLNREGLAAGVFLSMMAVMSFRWILPLYQTEKDRNRTELQPSRHPTPAPRVTGVHQPGLKKPKTLRPSKVIPPARNQGLKHMDLWGTLQSPAVARALCLRRNANVRKSSNLKSNWKKSKPSA